MARRLRGWIASFGRSAVCVHVAHVAAGQQLAKPTRRRAASPGRGRHRAGLDPVERPPVLTAVSMAPFSSATRLRSSALVLGSRVRSRPHFYAQVEAWIEPPTRASIPMVALGAHGGALAAWAWTLAAGDVRRTRRGCASSWRSWGSPSRSTRPPPSTRRAASGVASLPRDHPTPSCRLEPRGGPTRGPDEVHHRSHPETPSRVSARSRRLP